MYVQIIAVAAAACLFVLAAVLWAAGRYMPAAAPLRLDAIAQTAVGAGLLIRWWAPDSSYGPVIAAATIAYGTHGFWILRALRELRGWPVGGAAATWTLSGATLASLWGLWMPGHALAGLGLAYVLIAGLYLACCAPAFWRVEPGSRLPLGLVGACGVICALMYIAWGGTMMLAPAQVAAHGSGPALATSFLVGLWLNIVASSGYLLLVLRRLLAEIEDTALTDPLTGAVNRRGLQRWLTSAKVGPRPRGLVVIDIDHFKQVNDRLGHAAGDQVLSACAERLRSQLRSSDLLARIGDEEFLAIVEAADAAKLDAIAERLRDAVAASPIALEDGHAVAVTISLGTTLATTIASGDVAHDIARADAALYRAKQAGRNRVMRAEASA